MARLIFLIETIEFFPHTNFHKAFANYDTKVNEIEKKITDHNHDKYITTPEFNKLTAEKFAAK